MPESCRVCILIKFEKLIAEYEMQLTISIFIIRVILKSAFPKHEACNYCNFENESQGERIIHPGAAQHLTSVDNFVCVPFR